MLYNIYYIPNILQQKTSNISESLRGWLKKHQMKKILDFKTDEDHGIKNTEMVAWLQMGPHW